MRRLLLCLVLLLGLAWGRPADAQILVEADRGREATSHLEHAVAAMAAVNAASARILSDPAVVQAADLPSMTAALNARRELIAEVRTEIQGIAGDLSDLPDLARPGDPVEFQQVDQMVDQIADYARSIELLVGEIETFRVALNAGDMQSAGRAMRALSEGSVKTIDAMVLGYRARLVTLSSDSADYAMISGAACMYEGFAAMLRASQGLRPVDESTAVIGKSRQCLAAHVLAGRAALDRDATTPVDSAILRRLVVQIVPVKREMFDQLAEGGEVLKAATAALATMDRAALAIALDRFVVVDNALMQLSTRQVEIYASQGQ